MKSSFGAWDGAQERLRRLLDPGSDRAVLLQLLETSCQLELSKLASTDLGVGAYLRSSLDVLTQFVPLDAAVLAVRAPGLPDIVARYGPVECDARAVLDDAVAGATDFGRHGLHGFPLVVGRARAGVFAVTRIPTLSADPAPLAAVAGQVASGLEIVVGAERLRRQVAAANALSLAAALDETSAEPELEALAAALALLPGCTGAAVTVEGPAWGGKVSVSSGALPAGAVRTVDVVLAGGYPLQVRLAQVEGDLSAGADALDTVLTALVTSLNRVERNRRLLEDAETDPLTGVGNRRRATTALKAALARADRTGEPVAVLMFDLDRFKRVNDALGHAAGDAVLRTFAQLLQRESRAYDTVARMGGEEFLLVCPGCDGFAAQALADRFRRATPGACAAVLPDGSSQTVSIGVAVFPESATQAALLLRRADDALYEAKRRGRDAVCLAAPAPASR